MHLNRSLATCNHIIPGKHAVRRYAVNLHQAAMMKLPFVQAWLADNATRDPMRDSTDRLLTLYDICKAVEYLHVCKMVHRELKPAIFMWYPRQVQNLAALSS